MTIPARLSFITLGVRDHEAMRDFYAGLGWPITVDMPGQFVAFQLNGFVLALYGLEPLGSEAAPEVDPLDDGAWRGITLSINVARRDEVDGLWQEMVDHGFTPVGAPVDREYGPRSGYVADPEGNRWEIAYADGIELDAAGNVTAFG
jgi:catechol 2,3-dioxygenase-like lactoylglutathione lyase family enzyme